MSKLSHVLAVVNQVKTNAMEQVTGLYQQLDKAKLTVGLTRTYKPLTDDGETLPDENSIVQMRVEDVLRDVVKHLTPLYDVSLQRDAANCEAKADLVVDGETLLKDVPATYLLWLEKQVNHMHTIICKLPTLPAEGEWTFDQGSACYKDTVSMRARTKKVPKPITLCEATKEHPAQVQLAHEDIIVGYWHQTALSGAIPRTRAQELRDRVETLLAAIKTARETANHVEAPKKEAGAVIFRYLFRKES